MRNNELSIDEKQLVLRTLIETHPAVCQALYSISRQTSDQPGRQSQHCNDMEEYILWKIQQSSPIELTKRTTAGTVPVRADMIYRKGRLSNARLRPFALFRPEFFSLFIITIMLNNIFEVTAQKI